MPLSIGARRTINHVSDLVDELTTIPTASEEHAHVRLWFRGHASVQWELQPAVYRPGFPTDPDEKLRVERHLFQDFAIEAASVLTHTVPESQLYFLAQHYRLPTRLLDWTASPFTALYFACADERDPTTEQPLNGAVYLMDAYRLAPQQSAPRTGPDEYRGIVPSGHSVFQRARQSITLWRDPAYFPPFIMAVRPDHFDARITSQRSYFTFHVPSAAQLTRAHNDTLQWLEIPAGSKEHLRQELFILNTDEFSIYRDLDHLASRLRYAYGI